MRQMGIALATLILGLSVMASANVPPMMSYQGKLLQPSGAPVPDGTYQMQFAIYDVPTGGTALWSETNTNVQVKGGLFATMLGSVVNLPPNIFDNPSRFFGVKVGADPEMTPRQQVASSAFAFKAAVAGTVDNGAITTDKLADGAVTDAKIVDGSVSGSKLADRAVTASKIYDGAVTATALSSHSVDYSKLPSGMVIDKYCVPWFGLASETCYAAAGSSYAMFGKYLQDGGWLSAPAVQPGLARRFRLAVSASNDLHSGADYLRIMGPQGQIVEMALGSQWAAEGYTSTHYSETFAVAPQQGHWRLEAKITGGTLWIHNVQLIVEDYVP